MPALALPTPPRSRASSTRHQPRGNAYTASSSSAHPAPTSPFTSRSTLGVISTSSPPSVSRSRPRTSSSNVPSTSRPRPRTGSGSSSSINAGAATDPSSVCVYLPLTSAQLRHGIADVLQGSDAFAIRTLDGGRCRPVRIDWVVLPSSEDSEVEDSDCSASECDDQIEDANEKMLYGDAYFKEQGTLEDKWEYTFEAGDPVWIKTSTGHWVPGRVAELSARVGTSRTHTDVECVYYPVHFGTYKTGINRRYFAPLNGDVKPDTTHVRRLLRQAGRL